MMLEEILEGSSMTFLTEFEGNINTYILLLRSYPVL